MDSAERGEEESSTTFASDDDASLGYQLLVDESGTSTTAAVSENSSSSSNSSSTSPKNFRRVKSNACVRASDGGWHAAVLEWLWSRSCRKIKLQPLTATASTPAPGSVTRRQENLVLKRENKSFLSNPPS